MMDRRILTIGIGFALLGASAARGARADELSPTEVVARRDLIEQAQRASVDGDHPRALELATRAGKLGMSVSLRRFIAEEQFATGDFASAAGTAEICGREASASTPPSVHGEACAALSQRARPLLGYVVVTLPSSTSSAVVHVQGRDLPGSLVGQRYAVNPGDVSVDVTAKDAVPFHTTVRVSQGESVDVAVSLVAAPLAPRKESPTARPKSAFRLSPLVPIGAGFAGAGLVVAIGVGVSGQLALDDYADRCTREGAASTCGGEAKALAADLDVRATVVNVAISVGVAGVAAGTVGMFLSTLTKEQKAALWRGQILF